MSQTKAVKSNDAAMDMESLETAAAAGLTGFSAHTELLVTLSLFSF